jgi:hypothetical protein
VAEVEFSSLSSLASTGEIGISKVAQAKARVENNVHQHLTLLVGLDPFNFTSY